MATISYALLCAALAIQSTLLVDMISEVRRIRERYPKQRMTGDSPSQGLRQGARVPAFEGRLLDSGGLFTERSLRNRKSVMFFVEARRVLEGEASEFCASLAGLMTSTGSSTVFVICKGNDESCRHAQSQILACGARREDFPVVLDGEDKLSGACKVSRRPAALVIDEQGLVLKVGRQLEPEEIELRKQMQAAP